MEQVGEGAFVRDIGSESKPTVWCELTIAVPAYARPLELEQLLRSVEDMDMLPGELLICEDASQDRPRIREIAGAWTPRLAARACRLNYVENDCNLGYDANVRKLFSASSGEWVMLIGNDDIVLPDAVRQINSFLADHPDLTMASSAYLKFRGDPERFVGLCRLSASARIYDQTNSLPRYFVKLAGFVGGLVFRRSFAQAVSSESYDGTLYYQMYLAALAYCGTGIGYIPTPIVASRMGNAPLFGAASAERSVHRPGRYSAQARLAMWEGLLTICQDVQEHTGVSLVEDVKLELARNQSFHVFEAVASQGRGESIRLVRGLRQMGLMSGWATWIVAAASVALGRHAGIVFRAARGAQAASALLAERYRVLVGRAAFPS